jgi:hypothetical protein
MGWKYGRLADGRPFRKWIDEGDEKPHTLAGVRFTKREEDTTPMDNLSEADKADLIIKGLMAHGIPLAESATVAHRNEVATKRALIAKIEIEEPATKERNDRLKWISDEADRLKKLGGMSANAAVDQAMRNWGAQNNSPGQ